MSGGGTERQLTFVQALNEALDEEMARCDDVFLIGEDIGLNGGIYKVTEGLADKYGSERVIDSPISEAGITGMAVGAAMTGSRPVVEIMFGDFLCLAMDQIINQAAKVRYMSGGKLHVPLVVRTTLGAGRRMAAQHSQSLHAMMAHVPGLKVVVPSTPEDGKGLLKSSIRDDDPVIFFEDKLSYRRSGPVSSDPELVVPLGSARVVVPGEDLTIVAISSTVHLAVEAAALLASDGRSVEVIDVRTLWPLDTTTVLESVRKTSRCLVVDEGYLRFGATAEIASLIAEGAFGHLSAPVRRIASMDVPVPFSPELEDLTRPSTERILTSARELLEWSS